MNNPNEIFTYLLDNYSDKAQEAVNNYNTACELDKDYYKAAMKRLKQHQA